MSYDLTQTAGKFTPEQIATTVFEKKKKDFESRHYWEELFSFRWLGRVFYCSVEKRRPVLVCLFVCLFDQLFQSAPNLTEIVKYDRLRLR